MSVRAWLGAHVADLHGRQRLRCGLLRRHFEILESHAPQHKVPDGENWDETIFNMFKKSGGKIHHFWGSEMAFAPSQPNQHHRAGDLVDPMWNLLDMTPEGQGETWFPKVGC